MIFEGLAAKLLVGAAAVVGIALATHVTDSKIYNGKIAELQANWQAQVAAAQEATAKAESRERQKESQAAQAARKAEDEHQQRQAVLEASNAALADAGNKLRNRYALLAAQASRVGKDSVPSASIDAGPETCWKLLGTVDRVAEGSGQDSERLAEQVRGLQGYVESLRPFMAVQ